MQVTIRKFYYIKLAMTLSKHFCNTLKQMPCSARVEKIPCSSLAAFMALALPTKLSLSQPLSFLTSALLILSSTPAGGRERAAGVKPDTGPWSQGLVELGGTGHTCWSWMQQALSGRTVPGCCQGCAPMGPGAAQDHRGFSLDSVEQPGQPQP